VFLVADGGGEEFQKAARGLVAGRGDHARHHDAMMTGDAGGRCSAGTRACDSRSDSMAFSVT
jgi:hypothetical protein